MMINQRRISFFPAFASPILTLLYIIIFSHTLTAQDVHPPVQSISGTVVTKEDDTTLPGVTVLIKGSNKSTATDNNGTYKIDASANDILIFTIVGYTSREMPVGQKSIIDVELEIDSKELSEVIVVGYGQEKRSNLTGSITSIKIDNLKNRPISRLDQALQGMSSGVYVTKGGGAPGSSPTIHIRGVGSIGNTDPLWIVDGIKMNPGNHFNPDDIASIEILKDAASSAIYGAEAAHGVILVTTKRGIKGKTQVSYNNSFAKVNAIKLPTLLGSEDFVYYKKQSRINAGQNPEPSWDNWIHDTDWINAFYAGDGFSQNHNLSIAKGADKSNYFLSLGYNDEHGILIDNTFKRYSLRLNSDYELTDFLTVGESVLLSRVNENPIGNFNEDYKGAIPYRSIPIMPIYDENNPYGGWGRAPVYFQGPNPVATQYQQHETRAYNRLDGSMYFSFAPLKFITVRGQVGYSYLGYLGKSFNEAFDYGAFANPINALTYSDGNDETITANLVATFTKQLGDHYVRVMGGYESSQFESIHFNAAATNFPLDVAQSFNLATGTFNVTDRQSVFQRRLLSQFGRITYNYKEKYLLEANLRRDASAPVFSPENIWGIFPSFSAGWKISKEPFMENFPLFSNLKLRGSIGTLGSDAIGSFIYSKTYTSQFSTYTFDATGQNKVSGFYISRFPNGEVKWEEVNLKNIGIDAEVLDGKLSFSVDGYIKDTKDLLYGVPLPASIGIAVHNFDPVNPQINIGSMRNTGIDLDLTYREHAGEFNFTLNGNVSFLKNKVLYLNGDDYITGGAGGGQIGGMTRTQAGIPISSFYGFVVQQMLNSEDDIFAINSYAADGIYQEAGTGPGDLMYVDLSGPNGVPDGKITWEHDRTYIGNPWPKLIYGFNLNIGYKQVLDLSLQFQGVQGVDIFNANKAYSRNFFGDSNTSTDIYEAWTPEHHTQNPRNIASDPNGNFSRPSTYFIEDGSYLKLRNAQLGFNFSKSMLKKLGGIGSVRLYINANNLLTVTGYSGPDPELEGSNVSRGIDYGLYPHTRTFGGGLDVQF
ncbi:MAG TPA: TonB-dependent receptor [Saprospiraceae bacterium]|nr:TonB-dependent receptor [Saprospiraceae bacterium]